jgi:hypothetical protein
MSARPVAVETESAELAASDAPLAAFDDEQVLRLCWLRSTVVAERYLVLPGQPCPDHQACRRLAFALWLRCTRRLTEDHLTCPPTPNTGRSL